MTLVKVLLAPMLIGLASLIARRWGPSIGGWFIALPLTSAPVFLILSLERGRVFVQGACGAILLAPVLLTAYAMAYKWGGVRWGWGRSTLVACGAYLVCAFLLEYVSLSMLVSFAVSAGIILIGLRVVSSSPARGARIPSVPWDMPLRMAFTLVLVLLVTTLAASLGPQWSGLLTPFPIATSILVAFTHHLEGTEAACVLLHGLLRGLFSFLAFFLVLGLTIRTWSLDLAFGTATIVALTVHGAVWYSLQFHKSSTVALEAGHD